MKKLEILGMRETAMEWIRSYPSHKNSKTTYGKEDSSLKEKTVEVPQGTGIWSDLFVTFTNDIVKSIRKCSIQLFVDDTFLTS